MHTSHTMMHSYSEFAAVSILALLSIITMSTVVGFITICAGISTIALNYFRYKKLKNGERTISKDNENADA